MDWLTGGKYGVHWRNAFLAKMLRPKQQQQQQQQQLTIISMTTSSSNVNAPSSDTTFIHSLPWTPDKHSCCQRAMDKRRVTVEMGIFMSFTSPVHEIRSYGTKFGNRNGMDHGSDDVSIKVEGNWNLLFSRNYRTLYADCNLIKVVCDCQQFSNGISKMLHLISHRLFAFRSPNVNVPLSLFAGEQKVTNGYRIWIAT